MIRHVKRPERLYDVVLVSRPTNAEAELAALRTHQPHAVVIYDCEALQYRRLESHVTFARPGRELEIVRRSAVSMRSVERQIPLHVDAVICVVEEEAEIIRSLPGACPVRIMPPFAPSLSPTSGTFAERADAVFVAGWLAGAGSPNADAVSWLASEIVPYVREHAPWVRILVTGADPPATVLEHESLVMRFVGHVDDLRSLYANARVALVPMRFGSGIKIKAVEALQHGVPIVTTSSGAPGLGVEQTVELAPVDDPLVFAGRLVALTTDAAAWNRARGGRRPPPPGEPHATTVLGLAARGRPRKEIT